MILLFGFVLKDADLVGGRAQQRERQTRNAAVAALRCPRCESTNTKFCYYNNYSKLQPRHYCRACRRHWTEGGALRNVPVGGSRKNKRPRGAQTTPADASDGHGNGRSIDDGSSSVFSDASNLPIIRQPTPPEHFGAGSEEPLVSSSYHESPHPFSSLPFYDCTGQDSFTVDDRLFAMETSMLHLPASNLSHWDDIIDLVNLELKPPAPDRVDHTLTY
ncbi:unnamed protein product [Musa acuminata subsp. malaccensis]|uniref:Dof zinc finger protein n=1 Tax=Musa acuminata subsp. malaccensis TaxID=214687 RepID=A0A804HSP2_MUSAM|nr:PREDICTED: dof zinc finger protein DOF1.4-like isoform X1 [Musa acuminata subsp. malaccensis]XP_018682867.1 PREDICTED: dof zinc finger protein DOF1.4-like isoform X1 [Musa acuminata subsp. malaccensis]CAG1859178.1 unnamed protein product [Musa acuminata subsp. malaccensis]